MRIKCNRNNIKTHAKTLLGNEHSLETEKALIKECLTGFIRTYGHISHDQAKHLERINAIMQAYGVEGILADSEGNDLRGTCSMDGVTVDCQYVNMGDTYSMTILYVNGKLYIGDWGSLFE